MSDGPATRIAHSSCRRGVSCDRRGGGGRSRTFLPHLPTQPQLTFTGATWRLAAVVGATGTLETVYVYDAAGQLVTRTDPNGRVTSWGYDPDGLPIRRTTPVGTWNVSYNPNGQPRTVETPAGTATPLSGDGTVTYSYDRMSRPTGVDYADGTPDVIRTYDLAGRLATMHDGAGAVSYSFDDADRPTDIVRSGAGAGLNGSLHYDYDAAGNITRRGYPDGTAATQTFDDDGQLASVAAGGQTTGYDYDAAGNLTTVTLPSGNGHVATRSFDRAGRLTTVENAKGTSILSRFQLTLDASGNPTRADTTRGAADSYDLYEYDARNRLTGSCFDVGAAATGCAGAADAISYAYDKVSNRTQEVRTGAVGNTGTITYAYNAADQLTSSAKGAQTTSFTYDANGNQASRGTRSFAYNLANQLTSTTDGGGTTTYAYDGDGQRVAATIVGGADLRYVWDPLADSGIPELALERTAGGNLARRYLNGPLGAVSFTDTSGSYALHRDPLGSVTDVTDGAGTPQWRYSYDGYGGERTAIDLSGTAPQNLLRFTGAHLDPETGLYHLRARQYDPSTGRFGALDPIENPAGAPFAASYVYVNGRPTFLIDPLGQFGLPSFDDIKNAVADAGQVIGNTAAGAADGATGGASTMALNTLGVHPDEDSVAFKGGQVVGTVAAVTSGGGAVVKLAGRAATTAGRRFAARTAGNAATQVTLDAVRAAIDGRPYTVRDAARAVVMEFAGVAAGAALSRCATRIFGGSLAAAKGGWRARLADETGSVSLRGFGRTFEKAGIETTEHFRIRLAQRGGRGVTEKAALDTYRQGRLFFDPRTGNYVRHSSPTGISVVTDAPSGGRAISVFEGKPSPDWNPVRWRPGQ